MSGTRIQARQPCGRLSWQRKTLSATSLASGLRRHHHIDGEGGKPPPTHRLGRMELEDSLYQLPDLQGLVGKAPERQSIGSGILPECRIEQLGDSTMIDPEDSEHILRVDQPGHQLADMGPVGLLWVGSRNGHQEIIPESSERGRSEIARSSSQGCQMAKANGKVGGASRGVLQRRVTAVWGDAGNGQRWIGRRQVGLAGPGEGDVRATGVLAGEAPGGFPWRRSTASAAAGERAPPIEPSRKQPDPGGCRLRESQA